MCRPVLARAVSCVVLALSLSSCSKDPEAVRHWAQVAHPRYQRGNAYVTKKEYDLALAESDRALQLNPSDAEAMPFPKEETTPPVTNTNRVMEAPVRSRTH